MKTIIHVLNTGSFSGAENVVFQIMHEMSNRYEKKYRFIYVALKGPIEKRLRENGLEYRLFDKISLANLNGIKKEINPDIVHAHDYTTSILCSLIFRKRVISHLHHNAEWIKSWNLKTVAYSISIKAYKKVLLVSKAIANEFVGQRLQIDKAKVIGNPINVRALQEKRSSEKKDYDIIFLGRLDEPKNPLRFVEIVRLLADVNKDLKVVMAGSGPMQAEVAEKISEYGLGQTIDMLGFVENPWYYLNRSKIMCITSKWEGFGLMAVEGMAAGLPIVSTKVGGLSYILGEENHMFCGTDSEFVSTIKALTENQSLYEKVVCEEAERLKTIDNIEKYCAELDKIYGFI